MREKPYWLLCRTHRCVGFRASLRTNLTAFSSVGAAPTQHANTHTHVTYSSHTRGLRTTHRRRTVGQGPGQAHQSRLVGHNGKITTCQCCPQPQTHSRPTRSRRHTCCCTRHGLHSTAKSEPGCCANAAPWTEHHALVHTKCDRTWDQAMQRPTIEKALRPRQSRGVIRIAFARTHERSNRRTGITKMIDRRDLTSGRKCRTTFTAWPPRVSRSFSSYACIHQHCPFS